MSIEQKASYPPQSSREATSRSEQHAAPQESPSSTFFDLIAHRTSARCWGIGDVPDAVIQEALQHACRAPSAGNLQAYRVVVVRGDQRRYLARACAKQSFVAHAPACLVFLADGEASAVKYSDRGTKLYSIQDATLMAGYTQLALEQLGVATVWVGAMDETAVAQVVGAPAGLRAVAVLPLGWPMPDVDANAKPSTRRPVEAWTYWGGRVTT